MGYVAYLLVLNIRHCALLVLILIYKTFSKNNNTKSAQNNPVYEPDKFFLYYQIFSTHIHFNISFSSPFQVLLGPSRHILHAGLFCFPNCTERSPKLNRSDNSNRTPKNLVLVYLNCF